MDLYPWLVFVHVLSVLVFVLAHGVSAFVQFRVHAESDRAKLTALLDLSAASLGPTFIALLVAFVSGVAAAIVGGHFAQFWPWAAIATLVIVTGVMTPLATYPLSAVRRGLGQPTQDDRKKGIVPEPVSDEELDALRAKVRTVPVAAIGLIGLSVLVWLMQAKPF